MQSPIDVGVTLSRIRYAKFVMEAAKNLNMIYWQTNKYDTDVKVNVNCSPSIGELHKCGNTACFAGYLAISPLWKMLKGTTCINGEPKWGKYVAERAVLKFFEIPFTHKILEAFVESLVLGNSYSIVGKDNYLCLVYPNINFNEVTTMHVIHALRKLETLVSMDSTELASKVEKGEISEFRRLSFTK